MNSINQGKESLIRVALSFIAALISGFIYSSNLACTGEINQRPLKIGFILVASRYDYGWNYLHDQGRLYLEKHLPGQVETTVVENVPENAEVERVMERMIAQGDKVIFATAYGYLESALKVAVRHPEIIILHAGLRLDPLPVKNVGTYFADPHDPIYVAGIVAGRMTKVNKIGYIGAHPVPPLLVNLNAFTLGVHAVNPKAKIIMLWTNSWHDPALEVEAVNSLTETGADIVFANLDSPVSVLQAAERKHLYSVACPADLNNLASTGWLTGAKWNWGPLYVKIIRSILDNTWQRADSRYDAKEGYVQLSLFGSVVPKAVQKNALEIFEELKTGKSIVFKGPIRDREGVLKIPAGQIADAKYLAQIDWVVSGVQGALPRENTRTK